jgi:flagellar hook-associated protein 3 FlgL
MSAMISTVSTSAIRNALQRSIQTAQRELAVRQREVQTGALADVAGTLGEKAAAPISLLRQVSRIDSILDTNKSASTRLAATQSALGVVSASTQTLFDSLSAAKGSIHGIAAASQSAKSQLGTLVSALNTAVAGQHIFAGLNTDVAPINPGNGIPAGDEMDAAFLSHFGFAKTDPAAALITPAAFQTFATSQIEPLFVGSGWAATVSGATDDTITSRITLSGTAQTSVSANETGVRRALFAASLSANFLDTPLNLAAKDTIVDRALQQSSSSISALTELQGKTGFVQQKLTDAGSRLSAQRDLFESAASDLTSVDPFDAATRLNALLTRIETSYVLTQKIQQLNILRYLG